MRLTIVADDRVVAIDELAFSNLSFSLDANVHAVQWNEVAGWVEYKSDAMGYKPPNLVIYDVTPYQSAIDAWEIARQSYVPPNNTPLPEPTPKEFCKATAQQLLYDTDWSVLPDVADTSKIPYLINVQEFIDYRNTVREFIVSPVDDPVFPAKPVAVWSN